MLAHQPEISPPPTQEAAIDRLFAAPPAEFETLPYTRLEVKKSLSPNYPARTWRQTRV